MLFKNVTEKNGSFFIFEKVTKQKTEMTMI